MNRHRAGISPEKKVGGKRRFSMAEVKNIFYALIIILGSAIIVKLMFAFLMGG